MWGNEEQRERAVSSKCYDIRDGDCFLVIAPTDRFQNLFLLLKPQLMSVHSVHHTWVIQKNMLERFLCKKWKKYYGLPSSKAELCSLQQRKVFCYFQDSIGVGGDGHIPASPPKIYTFVHPFTIQRYSELGSTKFCPLFHGIWPC